MNPLTLEPLKDGWRCVRLGEVQETTAYFTGAVGQQRVPDSFLSDYIIPLPLIEIQQRIAVDLKEKMAQVEKLQSKTFKQQSALNSLPQAILRKAFRGEL
ncbi:MAG: hypothetical protein A3I04_07890 [Nitrospinae bacterium RIFCSPLOWO2_02_FULL_39_110]|nr:MAG: hypothetical protein A3D97_08690 [Nitrospinae bacterium RIFCSPHIGHO2_12_FULL_39_42]OGW01191.1 MAG: hypothetical protein A3D20_06295 [Nitrospinae bacterium RIFCSPHIGHO2_02_FULL_39_82]OGW02011.1 MAG: hypothetical protein A2Z59_03065 [Nitrospinae bacterium RIFCSPLOWO2_02_39_17]OGW05265.1 MAG: hypothetical protein A3I04_07890 [Nitrospinae bacterium RIFCSPLOWO2_02_FULL_39_110]OGW11881.1 MAG: hypothetical protein A2W75_07810 [Nitrospinae bacterium RIFCSPLOWO2_12_39_15]